MTDDRPPIDTTELEHQHFCEICGALWAHADDSCPGPRWAGRSTWSCSWDCPMCEGQR